MQLPREVLLEHFDGQLCRGCILRYKAAEELSDPDCQARFKFALVLNVDCSESTILLAYTTSETDFFDRNLQFQYLIHRWHPGAYPWIVVPTILSLKELYEVARERLKQHIQAGELTFEGTLSLADMAIVEAILDRSPLIAPRTKKRILPPASSSLAIR